MLGDPVRLTQVVSNLLSNAAKFSDRGGRITLTLERDDAGGTPRGVVEVQDNGCGIDPAALPNVFEPSPHTERFKRGSNDGLGIGLVVVRGLVRMHDGQVEAFSDGPGRGARFRVRLPLIAAVADAPATEAPVAAAAPPARAGDAGALRILVVDDNEDSAESMSMLLQCEGHAVDTAYSGERAIELAGALSPDVVLLDIGMPGMLGYEVARRLRALQTPSRALLVAITGYGRETDVAKAREAGFDHHLVKPVDFERLRALLASRLASLQSG